MDTFNQNKTFDVNNYGTEDLLGILEFNYQCSNK